MRCLTLILVLVLLNTAGSAAGAQSPASSEVSTIASFNRSLEEATRRMDNDATIALWSDDGVSLLPSTLPIRGKPAIRAFLESVVGAMPNARMKTFTMRCFDIAVSGDWASEWCSEHQVVDLGASAPAFDGWGKMLLVLHRGRDGNWRLMSEMWNQALPDSSGKH